MTSAGTDAHFWCAFHSMGGTKQIDRSISH